MGAFSVFPLLLLISFGPVSNAKPSETHKKYRHHEEKAHAHGYGSLSLAFDDLIGRLEFEIPADSIVGFEHVAKSTEDKDSVSKALKTFETDIGKMVQLDSSLGCEFVRDEIKIYHEINKKTKKKSNHANFEASFNITCVKSIVGSQVSFNFSSFPKISKLNLTLLAGSVQKSVELGPKVLTINVK